MALNMLRRFMISIDSILYVLLVIFFAYAFFYQYAYEPINGALPLLGGMILLFALAKTRKTMDFYRPLLPLLGFTIYIIITGFLFSYSFRNTGSLLVSYFEYLLPCYGMYVYCAGNSKKLKNVLWGLWLAVTLIAVQSVVNGTVTYTGAISVGSSNTLSTNVLSSFLAIGLICDLILMESYETNKFGKIILILGLIIQLISQVNSASRRGIIVFLFLLIAGIYSILQIKYKGRPIVKFVLVLLLASGVIVAFDTVMSNSERFLIIERFHSSGYLGDSLRRVYQEKALELFNDNPIFGRGLGAVGAYAGMYSHSMYHEILACTGILGFLIFLLGMLIKPGLYFLRCNKKEISLSLKLLARLMLVFIVSILIGGVAVVYIYDMYFYVMIGLIFSAEKVFIEEIRVLNEEAKLEG